MTIRRSAAIGAAISAIAVLYAFDPAVETWFPSCPFRALTGWLCPLCGSLRAGHALLHGRIGEAFLLNPFVLVTSTVIAGTGGALRARLVPWAAAAAAVFTVARNLP